MNLGTWQRKHRLASITGGVLFGALALVVVIPGAESILASSGHEHAAQVWEATDWYRIMNFIVLAVALYLALRKPVAQALRGRIKGIQEELAELEERKLEAEKKLAQYNERLSLLEKEARKITDGYIEQGKEAQARILEKARSSAEKLEDQARRQIEAAFERAKAELQEAILEKAIEKAEAKIKSKITPEDQERLVDDYLKKVVA